MNVGFGGTHAVWAFILSATKDQQLCFALSHLNKSPTCLCLSTHHVGSGCQKTTQMGKFQGPSGKYQSVGTLLGQLVVPRQNWAQVVHARCLFEKDASLGKRKK